nr:META domain-containing protein [uncultured Flavobacterium sp.]
MKKSSTVFAFLLLFMVACNATKSTTKTPNSLQGEWVLTYITGPRIAFDGLYPDQKPVINFDLISKKVFGKNSCNNYTGMLNLDGNKMSFKESKMAVTMMACQGNGDRVYMDMLEKVDSYSISDDGKELTMTGTGVPLLRFEKK